MGTRSPRSGGALILCAMTLALLGVPRAALAGKSHLLQKPERHVVLTSITAPGVDECGTNWVDRVLAEIGPDGTAASAAFVVPAGYVLVVTDLDWRTWGSPAAFVQGRVHVFSVSLGPFPNPPVFRTGVLIDADLASAGIWTGSASLTTGFLVHPGVPICPRAGSEASGLFNSNSVLALTVRGYLVKSK